MGTEAWNDSSYDGRKLRGLMRRAYNYIDRETKKTNADWDKIFPKIEALSRMSHRHVKLIDMVELEERTRSIEKLLEHIPQSIISEAKVKAGL